MGGQPWRMGSLNTGNAPFFKKGFQILMPECLNHGWLYRITLQASMILNRVWHAIAVKKSGNATKGFP
jgi:hypothetical protein